MPELINANPTVIAASAIPSRHSKSSPDPFQSLLMSHTAPSDEDSLSDTDDSEPDRFDAQEIYGIPAVLSIHLINRLVKQYI